MSRTMLVALLFLAAAGSSWGQIIYDPADLFIGDGKSGSCPMGGCASTHPNVIGATNLSIYLNGIGHPALSDPLILILGIGWSGTGSMPIAPTLTAVNYYSGNGSIGTTVTGFGLYGIGLNGGDGQLTFGEINAYGQTSFNHITTPPGGPGSSNNFANWSSVAGPAINSFALYAYTINQSIGGGDLLDLFFAGGLPSNTFAIAYGCEGTADDALDGSCAGGVGSTYSTPFTEAGFFSTGANVPEPSSIILLGTVGLFVGVFAKRKVRLG